MLVTQLTLLGRLGLKKAKVDEKVEYFKTQFELQLENCSIQGKDDYLNDNLIERLMIFGFKIQ